MSLKYSNESRGWGICTPGTDEVRYMTRTKDQAQKTRTVTGRTEDREPAKEAAGAAHVTGAQPGGCVSQRPGEKFKKGNDLWCHRH